MNLEYIGILLIVFGVGLIVGSILLYLGLKKEAKENV